MSEQNQGHNASCGCGGCVSIILFILLFQALWFGLTIGDKKWNIDIFPPKIWEVKEAEEAEEAEEVSEPVKPVEPVEPVEPVKSVKPVAKIADDKW